ncbi:MAG: DUF192 domain-containing protein [Spirosomataceae bacterium]
MNRKLLLIVGAVLIAASGYYYWSSRSDTSSVPTSAASSTAETAPSNNYTKEGEVVFLKKDSNQRLKKIDVEIADTDADRMKGLMFRTNMPDSVGMLFVFEVSEPQAFWMKNTIMSLDIIYVNEKKQIVSIVRNAKPYSEESLPSKGNAQYVVEVTGGWCDKYGITEGDLVQF